MRTKNISETLEMFRQDHDISTLQHKVNHEQKASTLASNSFCSIDRLLTNVTQVLSPPFPVQENNAVFEGSFYLVSPFARYLSHSYHMFPSLLCKQRCRAYPLTSLIKTPPQITAVFSLPSQIALVFSLSSPFIHPFYPAPRLPF